jgi:hypothetical protein
MMGEIDQSARRLLWEMGYQATERSPNNPKPEVVPREAAQNLELEAPEYEAALRHLLALGDIELISEPTEGLYRLTPQGLRRAREMHWR